jgi:hypothetical protein
MTDTTRDGAHPGDRGAIPPPLTRSWLPEARPGPDDAYWDRYAARVLAEVEPRLVERRPAMEPPAPSWAAQLGNRWPTAALLAAAAVATLLAVGIGERSGAPIEPGADDLALALLVSEGDPALLWERLGIPADPLLAWLTFDGGRR